MALPPRPPPRIGASSPASEDAIGKSRREKDELERECQTLEEELEALKARYEQYFLGVERKEPVRQREELRKRVLRVKEVFTRNTGLKFRIQSLNARYLSYERMWLRSAREKEEGTYRRDIFKARLRGRDEAAQRPEKVADAKSAAQPPAAQPGVPAQGKGAPAAVPQKGAVAAPKAPQGPPAAALVGDAQMRALYAAYIAAKKSCNEDVSRLSYDAVAKSVSKQVPELMTRYKAKSVEFRVEVKGGKAVLKAIPKV